mmetsp:Transcript_18340/g.56261  ORF Transcript_18340/g.56261 Transcript_18340/m.56261 type:complete len:218 (-) Transcript_18340:452-1105(-)
MGVTESSRTATSLLLRERRRRCVLERGWSRRLLLGVRRKRRQRRQVRSWRLRTTALARVEATTTSLPTAAADAAPVPPRKGAVATRTQLPRSSSRTYTDTAESVFCWWARLLLSVVTATSRSSRCPSLFDRSASRRRSQSCASSRARAASGCVPSRKSWIRVKSGAQRTGGLNATDSSSTAPVSRHGTSVASSVQSSACCCCCCCEDGRSSSSSPAG